jgi:4-hydroxy-3-methylbut-2-enyl diphosphate reductase
MAISRWGAPLYVRHQIVHNRHVVQELNEQGAHFVESLKEVPEGSRVIFSAHGVPPEVYKEAEELGLKVVDATCPLVTAVHRQARKYASKGYTIILAGHRHHVEVEGTFGVAPDKTLIVQSVDEVADLNPEDDSKLVLLTQTTLSMDEVQSMKKALKQRFPLLEFPSKDICYATTNRQSALKQSCQEADLVIVVGSKNSSNSNRLKEVALNAGTDAILVDDASEILPEHLESTDTIAITAGASTPEHLVAECVMKLRTSGFEQLEERVCSLEEHSFPLPEELQ